MATWRVKVRLNEERGRKLNRLADMDRKSVSEVIGSMIDGAYEARSREQRKAAAQRLINRTIDDHVPGPDELSRQLNTKYDFEREQQAHTNDQ